MRNKGLMRWSRPHAEHPMMRALAHAVDLALRRMPDCCIAKTGNLVYIVTGGGLAKIGTTTRPTERIIELQVGSPIDLSPLLFARADRWFEQALHEMCDAHREHGEWFRADGVMQVLSPILKEADQHNECLRCAADSHLPLGFHRSTRQCIVKNRFRPGQASSFE